MKIGVFGTGFVGQTIAEKLAKLNHQVMIGTRNADNLLERNEKDYLGRPPFREWIKKQNDVKLGTFSEAAAFADMIINATNGSGTLKAFESADKENLKNKIVLDISNPLDFSKGMPPSFFLSNTDSLGELLQRTYPEVKVVKSLNTVNGYVMVNPSLLSEDHNIFISGNDPKAKEEIKKLLSSFGWKENYMIDVGDITTARGTEQYVALWVRLMGSLKTPMFNIRIVKGEHPAGI
jgi:8-hydroxy-5-deazaflavin:NADPH oxidoreductase